MKCKIYNFKFYISLILVLYYLKKLIIFINNTEYLIILISNLYL